MRSKGGQAQVRAQRGREEQAHLGWLLALAHFGELLTHRLPTDCNSRSELALGPGELVQRERRNDKRVRLAGAADGLVRRPDLRVRPGSAQASW